MKLGDLTWTDLAEAGPFTLVLPLGATEQHGPHLPLDTDTVIVDALMTAAAADRRDLVVAPPLQFGSSGEHAGFAGTLSLGQDALRAALVQLVRSADWAASVAVVCWHGGNVDVLRMLGPQLASEGRPIRIWQPSQPGDLHAGCSETSLMLYLEPERVRPARPRGVVAGFAMIEAKLRTGGVRSVSANGVLGDPTAASAEHGRELFASLVADLQRFLG